MIVVADWSVDHGHYLCGMWPDVNLSQLMIIIIGVVFIFWRGFAFFFACLFVCCFVFCCLCSLFFFCVRLFFALFLLMFCCFFLLLFVLLFVGLLLMIFALPVYGSLQDSFIYSASYTLSWSFWMCMTIFLVRVLLTIFCYLEMKLFRLWILMKTTNYTHTHKRTTKAIKQITKTKHKKKARLWGKGRSKEKNRD